MQVISRPFGVYRTNCYVIICGEECVVIDPGDGAHEWLKEQNLCVKAVLNTHGHFDHVANNKEVVTEHNCALFCPQDDVFLLSMPEGFEPSNALASAVAPNSVVNISGFGDFKFWHFGGHTPGCSLIEWQKHYFSGDFLFSNTIGRCDFAYSSPEEMKRSLKRALKTLQPGYALHPGHGLGCTSEQVLALIPEFLSWGY